MYKSVLGKINKLQKEKYICKETQQYATHCDFFQAQIESISAFYIRLFLLLFNDTFNNTLKENAIVLTS
jgi:hypothetical protein